MKYIYIAGLEHSGSTLLSELIAKRPGVLGLGEVGAFFSPEHMRAYLERWGREPDARLCSCGQSWEECPFWSAILELSGEYSGDPLVDKYALLLRHVRDRYPDVRAVVDSTKNEPTLRTLVGNLGRLGLDRQDLLVLLAVKDVRSFTASIRRKTGSRSLLWAMRTMNWWHGATSAFLQSETRSRPAPEIVLYENLCLDPDLVIDRVAERCALGGSTAGAVATLHESHIAMGNKDFLMCNRARVRYDAAWYLEDEVNLAYVLHARARRLNRRLYEEAIPAA